MTYQDTRADVLSASHLAPSGYADAAGHAGAGIAGRQRAGLYAAGGKRALDVFLVVMMAGPVLVMVMLLAVLAALDGASPFYGHERVGRGGRIFRCWKLRSMVRDSAARLERHLAENPEAAREWAETQKLARDPRVTPVGRFLRKTSLDELPQLWNVLRGDMSLVGPRPVTQGELERYGADRRAYLAVRPGITGLWQVSGRNDISYGERVALDARYAREVDLATDLRILVMTGPAVLRLTGK